MVVGFRDCVVSESRPHPQFGRAEVDLFASRRNCQCTLWFSMARRDNPPLRVNAFAHELWPRKLLYAFPPLRLIPPLLGRVRRERLSVILVAPDRRGAPWFAEVTQMMVGQPWAIPQFWGGDVSGSRCNRGVTLSGPTSPGLAPERDRLRQGGLSDKVIQTIQAAGAESTCGSVGI